MTTPKNWIDGTTGGNTTSEGCPDEEVWRNKTRFDSWVSLGTKKTSNVVFSSLDTACVRCGLLEMYLLASRGSWPFYCVSALTFDLKHHRGFVRSKAPRVLPRLFEVCSRQVWLMAASRLLCVTTYWYTLFWLISQSRRCKSFWSDTM